MPHMGKGEDLPPSNPLFDKFLCRVVGHTLPNRLRISVKWEKLKVEPATPPCLKEPVEAVWASDMDAPWPTSHWRCTKNDQLGQDPEVTQGLAGSIMSPSWGGDDLGLPKRRHLGFCFATATVI